MIVLTSLVSFNFSLRFPEDPDEPVEPLEPLDLSTSRGPRT